MMTVGRYIVTVETAETAAVILPGHADPVQPVSADVRAERIRTLDQIKRLYAVVMGFAVTQCFTNIYKSALVAGFDSYSLSILFGDGFVLISLVALFYLGAERTLDKRYLSADSRVATRTGLLLDLAALGITSILFLIMAETVETLDVVPKPTDAMTIRKAIEAGQTHFIAVLCGLYAIDEILIALQIIRISRPNKGYNREDEIVHLKWLTQNTVSLALTGAVFYLDHKNYFQVIVWELSGIAGILFIFHLGRFFFDLLFCFEFYYPGGRILSKRERA